MTQAVVRQRVRGVTRRDRMEGGTLSLRQRDVFAGARRHWTTIAVFHDSRDSHPLLQDAMVWRPVWLAAAW